MERVTSENILKAVTLNGVLVPWVKSLNDGRESEYKLVCSTGVEYPILADQDWKSVLPKFCWEEVKVKGLLNMANLTLIPQKVFPKGPTGERENVIDLADWKNRRHIKKMAKSLTELVLIPAAIVALMV